MNYTPRDAGPTAKPSVDWSVEATTPDVDGYHVPWFTTPVVVGRTLYVGKKLEPGPETPASDEQYLQAYDVATGERRFQYRTGTQIWSPPVLTDETVFVATKGTVHAIARVDATPRWTHKIDGNGRNLTVSDDRLYVTTGNSVRCLDVDGEREWVTEPSPGYPTSVAAGDGIVYVGTSKGNVAALDATDGTELWSYESFSGRVEAVTTTDCAVLVLAGDRLHAFDAAGFRHFQVERVHVGLATDGRVAHVVSITNRVRAVDLTDGATVWETPSGTAESAPVFAGDTLYAAADGHVRALDATDGSERWEVEPPTVPESYDGVASLAVSDNSLYASVGDHLLAIS